MQMKIKLSRAPHNVRVGSLAWAATLPADKWSWKTSRRGDESDRLDIYNGDLLIASLCIGQVWDSERGDHLGVDSILSDSIYYGGERIGDALYNLLHGWADKLDLEADDHGEMDITSA